MPRTLYLIGWAAFGLRFVLWVAYSLLAFLSKPGTRRLMPLALLVLAVVWFGYVSAIAEGLGITLGDTSGISGYGLVAIAYGLLCGVYLVASRFLSLVLSVFPPIRRPLPPVAPLMAPKRRDQPVPVKIAVPPFV